MNDQVPRGTGSRGAWARLVSNSNWNFAAFAIVVLANFLTLPYVVQRLGIAQFGLGGLVLALLAPMMFVGTVIGQACVREMAPLLVSERFMEARQVLSSALALCLGGCLLVLVALGLGAVYLIEVLAGPQSVASVNLPLVVLVASAGWVAQQMFLVLQATIVSTQQFRALATVNVASALASSLCLLLATWISPTVLGFLWGTTLGFVLTLLLTFGQAHRHAAVLFPLTRPRAEEAQRILAFCRWQAPAQLSGAFALQTDRYLLGATAALSVLGQFNIATRLQEVVYMGVLKISEVLFPHFSAGAGKPAGQQASVFMTSSWLVNALAAAALAPLIPLSAALITLWVGPVAVDMGSPMLRTLVTAGIVGSGVNVFTYYAMGNGFTRRLGVMSMVHAAAVVVCSLVLILGWGALAAGLGFLLANLLRLAWATLVTPSMVGGEVGLLHVMQATLLPLVAGLMVGWSWPVPVPAMSWFALVFNYALIGISVLAASLALSALFPVPRVMMASVVAGLRGHFSKR